MTLHDRPGSAARGFQRLGLAIRIANLRIGLGRAERIPGLYSPEAVAAARVKLAELEAEFDDPA